MIIAQLISTESDKDRTKNEQVQANRNRFLCKVTNQNASYEIKAGLIFLSNAWFFGSGGGCFNMAAATEETGNSGIFWKNCGMRWCFFSNCSSVSCSLMFTNLVRSCSTFEMCLSVFKKWQKVIREEVKHKRTALLVKQVTLRFVAGVTVIEIAVEITQSTHFFPHTWLFSTYPNVVMT